MTIVDTSVWIDLLGGTHSPQADWLKQHIRIEEIGILDLSLCEILQGVSTEGEAREILQRFQHFRIYTSSRALAVRSAENYRRLRSHGVTVRGTIDSIIATFCIDNGMRLLHSDRDFRPFEEWLSLQVVHP